jgi:hypothetical protein
VTTALLVLGYVLAVPFTIWVPGFQRLWKRREVWVLAVEEVGAGLISVSWAVKGNTGGAVFNGFWTVGLLVAWLVQGRRLADR